jgi:hypothetical protein
MPFFWPENRSVSVRFHFLIPFGGRSDAKCPTPNRVNSLPGRCGVCRVTDRRTGRDRAFRSVHRFRGGSNSNINAENNSRQTGTAVPVAYDNGASNTDFTASMQNNALELAIASGSGRSNTQFGEVDVDESFASQLAGKAYSLSFDLTLSGSGLASDVRLGLGLSDDAAAEANRFGADLGLSILGDGRVFQRGDNSGLVGNMSNIMNQTVSFTIDVEETTAGNAAIDVITNGTQLGSTLNATFENQSDRTLGLRQLLYPTSENDSSVSSVDNFQVQVIPTPSSFALGVVGLGGLLSTAGDPAALPGFNQSPPLRP